MDLTQILVIALILIAGIVIFKVVSSILRTVVTISALITIALVIGGILVYMDAKEFRNNTGDYTALIKEDGKVLAGTTQTKEGKSTAIKDPEAYSADVAAKNYPPVIKDSYKLIIIDIKAVEELGASSFEVDGEPMGKNFAIQVLKSDDAAKLMPKYAYSEDAKAAVLEPALRETMKTTNFFSQYKKENIIIYPETAMFKAIRFIPAGIISKMAGSALNSAKEKIGIQK